MTRMNINTNRANSTRSKLCLVLICLLFTAFIVFSSTAHIWWSSVFYSDCPGREFEQRAKANHNIQRDEVFHCENDGRGNALLFHGGRRTFDEASAICSGYNAQIIEIFDNDYNDEINNYVSLVNIVRIKSPIGR